MTAPKTSGIAAATGRAEDEQEDDQEDRQGDQLAVLGGVDRAVLDLAREGRVAGLDRAHRRVDLAFEDRVQLVDRVVDGVGQADVEVDDHQRPVGAGPQRPDRASVPGREGRHRRVGGAQGADQLGPLAVDGGGRAAQQDRERRGVAEVFAQDAVGLRRRRPGNVQRGRAQPPVDARPEDREERAAPAPTASRTARGCPSKPLLLLEDTGVVWRHLSRRGREPAGRLC